MEKPKLIKLTIKDMGAPIWINPATIESIQPLGNIHQGGIYSKIQFAASSKWTTVLETPEQILEAILETINVIEPSNIAEEYVSIGWVESAYSGDPDTRESRTLKTVNLDILNNIPIGTKVYVLAKYLNH